MKTLSLVIVLSLPAAAGTLESDAVDAAAPFEGLAEFAPAPAVAAEEERARQASFETAGPAAGTAREPSLSRPSVAAPASAPYKRPRTFDDGFMDGFGFVEWPAVALISWNMSCRTGLCEGNAAVGAFGYGLGVLLMPPACVAGLVTAAWWAAFG
jgi:hypothetical protein